ncbi:Phage integrase family [Pseudovibrio sp. FO-BEG1]|nr:tyrosine-type recombinase/integrase [Pseudovibrio sp. FO-BEG1]AEV37521.1 Phage integrase family [Pseudovibrio sp. FO-BEG1]
MTIALHTDSREIALTKAGPIEAQLLSYWEALRTGSSEDADALANALRELAQASGFNYAPMDDLVSSSPRELIDRLMKLEGALEKVEDPLVPALLGNAKIPPKQLSLAFEEYFDFTKDQRVGMNDDQVRKWRNPRLKAVNNLVKLVGDKPILEITRNDAKRLREWWVDRLLNEGKSSVSANKDIGHLAQIYQVYGLMHELDLDNPFAGMRVKKTMTAPRAAFSPGWMRNEILAEGALGGLNEEARDVFLFLINTGIRPSELIGSLPEHLMLDGAIPYFEVRAYQGGEYQRKLKTEHSARDIPLVGVSLAAARRLKDAGGVKRYFLNSDLWSNTVNKYLEENGLRESERHTVYSLRHAFEENLLEAGVDERIRVELMGHAYNRPKYGPGGSLELKLKAIQKIAF